MGSVSCRRRSPIEDVSDGRTNSHEDDPYDLVSLRREANRWRRFVDLTVGRSADKAECFHVICGLCLAQPSSESDLRRFRKAGYLRLTLFVRMLSRRELLLLDVKLIVCSCLSLLSYYEERLRDSKGCDSYAAKRRVRGSRDLLAVVLDVEMPEREVKVVRTCIAYFTAARQWDFEDVVLFVFQQVLSLVTTQEVVLTKLIKAIEVGQRRGDVDQAYMITASLALILENIYLDVYQFTLTLHKCFNTLLKLFLLNDIAGSSSTDLRAWRVKFRIQIKTSIRNFISKIRDHKGLVSVMDPMAEILMDPEVAEGEKVDLVEMMALCAQRLPRSPYRDSISPTVLEFLLAYLKSDRLASAMASQRILHHLLDRRDNLKYFREPIYHFKGRSSFVVNTEYSREDVHFFKSFSRDFFAGMYGCLNRYTEMTSLVSSYTTICLLLVEVPDPITTINMIHVVIKTQNNFLRNPDKIPPIRSFHVNAVVASVLSLICLIHGEEVEALGRYVQEVVSYRNQNSPHLLPPLSPQYNMAKHHTTAYHHQLYFLEEEILYALKRCWLGYRRSN